MTRARFTNVERKRDSLTGCQTERDRRRRAVKREAHTKADTWLDNLLDGSSGEFRTFMIGRVMARCCDALAAHHDPAFACASAGYHANRIGRQIVGPALGAKAEAEALFGGEGGE